MCSVLAGCAGNPAPAPADPAQLSPTPKVEQLAPAPQPPKPEPTQLQVPTECVAQGELCLPPRAFAKAICQEPFPGITLQLFSKASPFTRGYVRSRTIKAINTLGGPSSDRDLSFGEEVLIVIRNGGPGAGQMQVSGMGGYEVLRWDGTCATLSDGELAYAPPIQRGHAPLTFKYLDDNIQEALLTDQKVKEARKEHRKHCRGVSLGRRSGACVQADDRLNRAIVSAVRSGIELPPPERLPLAQR